MANRPRPFDETVIDADTTRRVATVITALIRAGVLRWSARDGAPVTGHPDQLTGQVEDWLRYGHPAPASPGIAGRLPGDLGTSAGDPETAWTIPFREDQEQETVT